eukprot:TRINITY_DN9837_c0_g1_i1.p1 TRINITY_DN9837_c0_g1~~TRINITY_DN9837_c0_g1_i1.p1  ORF type:complete len:495 (+),score=114.01 TRINITY_DN9837_c0_g1_i1:159-1487(+)
MGIHKIESFPFPTQPDEESVVSSLITLENIGALDKQGNHDITKLGKAILNFPLSPRYGKMLLLGEKSNILDHVIAIVAVLTVGDPILRINFGKDDEEDMIDNSLKHADQILKEKAEKEERTNERKKMIQAKKQWASPTSDLLCWLNAVGAYEYSGASDQFCRDNYLHMKSMREIHKLMHQLKNLVNRIKNVDVNIENMTPPDNEQILTLRQIITAGFVDNIAKREPVIDPRTGRYVRNRFKYKTCLNNTEAYIHLSSILARSPPEYISYNRLISPASTEKTYILGVTAVESNWLVELGTNLCTYSEPRALPVPRYNPKEDAVKCFVIPYYGPYSWELQTVEIDYPVGIDCYKYFARFFLEGIIFPKMKQFSTYYLTQPSLLTKDYSGNKLYAVIQPLLNHEIRTKRQLKKIWARDSTFLLAGVKQWLPASQSVNLEKIWPPL